MLVQCGFSFKGALLANFLGGCTSFLGIAIGIYSEAAWRPWLLMFTAGMFLYISLYDMVCFVSLVFFSLSLSPCPTHSLSIYPSPSLCAFVSVFLSFLGIAIGIYSEAAWRPWLLMLTAGMFLYISLCDMVCVFLSCLFSLYMSLSLSLPPSPPSLSLFQ